MSFWNVVILILLILAWFGVTFFAFMIVFGEKLFAKPVIKREVIYIEIQVDEESGEEIYIDISTGEIQEKEKVKK
jgi:hypothetical protein